MKQSSIYVSSSCVNFRSIKDSVRCLADAGFRQIELSGGTHAYPAMLDDLLELQQQYQLSYRCHNYFPPPQQHFVLNLSALLPEDLARSVEHVAKAIDWSQQLGGDKLAIHAGFRIQPEVRELGQPIALKSLMPEEVALQRFCEVWPQLKQMAAAKGVTLYIENNVFSYANKLMFQGENPFLATDHNSIQTLLALTGSPLLLDVAHLKVSAHSLGFDFATQLRQLFGQADYIHLSDNNGEADSNQGLVQDSELYALLAEQSLADKTFTLEVYDGIDSIIRSYQLVQQLLAQETSR